MKVDHYLPPYTKINSKWIKDLNLTLDIIKLLEENIRSTVFDIGLSCTLPNTMSTQARERKEKIYKWDYMRLKDFCKAKKTMNKTKRQGQPRGLVVNCASSATDGPGSDPRRTQMHRLSGHAEATSHIQQLEGCATMTYNYQLGLWGKNKGGGLAIDVSSELVFLRKKEED